MTPEPFESTDTPTPPRKKRGSALCDSIVATNPTCADRPDAELIALHHRAIFERERTRLRAWRDAQPEIRAEEFETRLNDRKTVTQRHARNDLVQIRIDLDRATGIAASIVADDLEFRAMITTLGERLFA